MDIIHSLLPFFSPVIAMAWTYKLITNLKFDKLAIVILIFLYLVSTNLSHLFFFPLLLVSFYFFSRSKQLSISYSIFYTLYSIFWITLLSVAIESSFAFVFEELASTYLNWIHYFSFVGAALLNYLIINWFKIDFLLLKKKDSFIKNSIIKPTNRIIISCAMILFVWTIFAENLAYSEVYSVFGGVYFSLLTSMYFIFMGILSTKIRTYLMYVIEKEKDQRYQELKRYTEDVELMQKEMAGFRHDMKNIWISFSEVIQSKDQKNIEKKFNEMKNRLEIQIKEADKVSQDLTNMKETITKGLLHQKNSLAKELNLEMEIDIKNEIKEIPMEMLDFVRIFGILVDNAIEEAFESEKKKVAVGFLSLNNKMIIEITNSTDKDQIPISKIFKEGYSTKEAKGENRGKGLAIATKLLKENLQANLLTNHQNGVFSQTLTIWKENEN